jgi:site-specific recombinase XerD
MNWLELFEDFVADQPDWDIKTRNYYKARLKPFGEFLAERAVTGPKEIQVRHVNRYLARMRDAGYSWSTRNGTFTAIQAWFGWLKQLRMIRYNPFAWKDSGLKRPRKTKRVRVTLPLCYIRRMIKAAEVEDTPMNRRDAAIMRLLITTGMRREEVVRLRLDNLDLAISEIRVIQGKGGHEREGFLPEETVFALDRWLAVRPKTFDRAVFVSLQANKKGIFRRLRPDAINDIVIKWRDQAGLPQMSVSPHKWRHTFASEVAKSDNIFALQQLLGHSDISTTRIYTEIPKEELRRVVRDFGPKIDIDRGDIDRNNARWYNTRR